jgi:hypothetical protein
MFCELRAKKPHPLAAILSWWQAWRGHRARLCANSQFLWHFEALTLNCRIGVNGRASLLGRLATVSYPILDDAQSAEHLGSWDLPCALSHSSKRRFMGPDSKRYWQFGYQILQFRMIKRILQKKIFVSISRKGHKRLGDFTWKLNLRSGSQWASDS